MDMDINDNSDVDIINDDPNANHVNSNASANNHNDSSDHISRDMTFLGLN
jgi:hypothetical protein